MIVQEILNSKGGGEVITVSAGSSVEAAAQLLSVKRIGSVVVSSATNTCAGILSERDIVRELGKRGPVCMSDKVDAIMTADIKTCAPGETAESVLSRMTEGRFRHMPVMDGDRMVGLISIGDVVKARLNELSMERNALEGMIMGH
ncbi:CBS domain-containing protein [Tropicimonas sp.]|uniref:CBS domain-containing protein n=1 Tax=Tropicimonas sp. TaxID=2067044 RepID=UPI003A8C0B61